MRPAGLILFAHGARDAAWAVPFEAVLREVRRQRPQLPVRLAFLEFMQPDLAGAARDLCAEGCGCVEVMPLFLGTGGHLRKELPAMLDALRSAHPEVRWTQHAPAGEHPGVLQAIATAALAVLPPVAAGEPP